MPNGRRFHLHRPHGVPKVVKKLLSSSRSTCQYPFFASQTVKTFAFARRHVKSSTVGIGYLLLFSCLLSGLGSKQIRRLPSDFLTTTRADTQSVGTTTGAMMPSLVKRYNSCFRLFSSATGTDLVAAWCGFASGFTSSFSFSWNRPVPVKTS